jgi:hypothetical protein
MIYNIPRSGDFAMKKLLIYLLGLSLIVAALPATAAPFRQSGDEVALAYVKDNVVVLADALGNPLTAPGPELGQWHSARLFWSPDGETLYIATRQGLFATGAQGGAAVRLPGEFGLTMAIARHGGVLYNLDVDNPQNLDEQTVTYPLRETNIANMEGGRGRLIALIGEYQAGTATATLSHAAAVYARDGGLLEGGRPQIYATYGGNLFFSCCFPFAGLGAVDLSTNQLFPYDATFVVGASALNGTASRLIGPTLDGTIRVIDLITGGTRDYALPVTGVIERTAWDIDETTAYFISRETPISPLELLPSITYTADTRSADLVLWELNLITGQADQIANFGDAFGASSMTTTDDFIFVVVVERNEALVTALNTGALPADIQAGDPLLDGYIPRTLLWRVDRLTGEASALDQNVWGVAARPD